MTRSYASKLLRKSAKIGVQNVEFHPIVSVNVLFVGFLFRYLALSSSLRIDFFDMLAHRFFITLEPTQGSKPCLPITWIARMLMGRKALSNLVAICVCLHSHRTLVDGQHSAILHNDLSVDYYRLHV